MAGYSGTPLPKKLGIKAGSRVLMAGVPAEVTAELKAALRACQIAEDAKQPLDFVMMCTKDHAELETQFPTFAKRLTPAGMIWVSWPKKSSGMETDLDENKVRAIGLRAGLVDVKVCAVSEVWSGLKFVIRLRDRRTAGA
jgi:hypothetical protein